jgi:hypothetical protein
MLQELRRISTDVHTDALPFWRIPHFTIRLVDWWMDSRVLVFGNTLGWKDFE